MRETTPASERGIEQAPMSEERLSEIDARANAAMPGPWDWFGNVKVNNVYLATQKFGRRFVLQFWRWGMNSAQPAFQIDHRMVTLEEMAESGHVVTDHNDAILRINHPDAAFIAHARTDIPDLLAEVRRLQTENFAMHATLDAAREETAQAVREERRCCAQIADDEASKSDDIDAGYLSAQRIARKIRSRSLPGETADA